MKSLQTLVMEVAGQMEGVRYSPYSSHGMHGRSCPSVSGSMMSCMSLIAKALKSATQEPFDTAMDCGDTYEEMETAHYLNEDTKSLIDSIMCFAQHSMDNDVVIYWQYENLDNKANDDRAKKIKTTLSHRLSDRFALDE